MKNLKVILTAIFVMVVMSSTLTAQRTNTPTSSIPQLGYPYVSANPFANNGIYTAGAGKALAKILMDNGQTTFISPADAEREVKVFIEANKHHAVERWVVNSGNPTSASGLPTFNRHWSKELVIKWFKNTVTGVQYYLRIDCYNPAIGWIECSDDVWGILLTDINGRCYRKNECGNVRYERCTPPPVIVDNVTPQEECNPLKLDTMYIFRWEFGDSLYASWVREYCDRTEETLYASKKPFDFGKFDSYFTRGSISMEKPSHYQGVEKVCYKAPKGCGKNFFMHLGVRFNMVKRGPTIYHYPPPPPPPTWLPPGGKGAPFVGVPTGKDVPGVGVPPGKDVPGYGVPPGKDIP